MKGMPGLVKKQPFESVRWRPAGPIALFRDFDAAPPNLVAQLFTVLGCTKPLELHVDRVQGVIFSWFTDRRVDDLLACLLALSAELRGQIDVLESSPTTHIEAENVLEVVSFLDPVLHHVREGRAAFRRQSRSSVVSELLDNLYSMVLRPFPDLILLDRN